MVLLTPEQVATELGINASTVRAMCDDGRISGVNTGKKTTRAYWRIPSAEIKRIKREGTNGHHIAHDPTNGHHGANGHGVQQPPSPMAPRLESQTVPSGWITVAEAAKRFGRSEQGVSGLAQSGKVLSVKMPSNCVSGFKYYINPDTMPEKHHRAVVTVAQTQEVRAVSGADRFSVMDAKLDKMAVTLETVAAHVAALVKAWNG